MNARARPTLRIVVLAAGFSARLGRPKALARVRGSSLIRRTIRLLAPLAAERIIVVIPQRAARAREELRGMRVDLVANPHRAGGLSTSVRRGLTAGRYSAALLMLPVDLVHLQRRDLERMITRWSGARRRVIARRVAEHGGTPVILPRWLWPRALGISGDRGLRQLLSELSPVHVSLLPVASAGFDVDTAQDLVLARRRWRAADQVRAVCTKR
jgi:molybdenum cofactor cytidylyltransferase